MVYEADDKHIFTQKKQQQQQKHVKHDLHKI